MRFTDYNAFAEALQATCRISDPWIEGKPRFRLEPVLIEQRTYNRFTEAAERIGALYDEFCAIILQDPTLLDFFDLTPYERLFWLSSGGAWHGIARLDLFLLENGDVQMCEMNSDTPSGEAETVLLNRLFSPSFTPEQNPNHRFAERFVAVLRSFGEQLPHPTSRIGIIFPTEIPEDLSMILCYEEWLRGAGWDVVMGAPYNLHAIEGGGVGMFGKRIDIALRHYKTDWWAERTSVWQDGMPFPDEEPLEREIALVLEASSNGQLQVVNPFGAVLTQNKLTMAFFWNLVERFSPQAQETIRRYVPETERLCDVHNASLLRKDEWVLKSDYGCEGDEVIIGCAVSDELWQQSLQQAIPTRWILQRFFDASPTDDGFIPNYGVYLLGGQASGIYTRLAPVSTDYRALSVATFVV
ncbi:MAG: glutathionylspermidine synthase family protein [Candidatus Kapabacteria bacterium]|jgi:glutathionylspermidine synthase|nr:glutathionylspermidine synthase family protein [Candidatus Kapabacteria bacterium]